MLPRQTRAPPRVKRNACILLQFAKVYWGDEPTSPDVRVLGLRPHARPRRRHRAPRWHRPHLPLAAGGRDLLPHDEEPRVRCLRDVALLLYRVAARREPALHRDPGVPVALLPPLV